MDLKWDQSFSELLHFPTVVFPLGLAIEKLVVRPIQVWSFVENEQETNN